MSPHPQIPSLGLVTLLAAFAACGEPPDGSFPTPDPRFVQRELVVTEVPTDFAIDGSGFVPVRTAHTTFYARGGSFAFAGNLLSGVREEAAALPAAPLPEFSPATSRSPGP